MERQKGTVLSQFALSKLLDLVLYGFIHYYEVEIK